MLYLDDIRDIVAILTENASEFSVKFSLGDVACDTVEDLQQLGGRSTNFKITVIEKRGEVGVPTHAPPLRSWLEISWVATYLGLGCASEDEFWARRGRITEIFESNSIWWRRAIQALFHGTPWWVYALFVLSWLLSALYYTQLAGTTIFALLGGSGWVTWSSTHQSISVFFDIQL